MIEQDLVHRLRKRAEIRRQISTRKSVQEGAPDRIADLLEEAASEIEDLKGKFVNKWEVILEEDENGEVILPFPPELIQRYGWLEGDEIEFEIGDGFAKIINTTAKMRETENGFG